MSSQLFFDSTPSEEQTVEERMGLNPIPDKKLRRVNPKRYDFRQDWYYGLNENLHDSEIGNKYDDNPDITSNLKFSSILNLGSLEESLDRLDWEIEQSILGVKLQRYASYKISNNLLNRFIISQKIKEMNDSYVEEPFYDVEIDHSGDICYYNKEHRLHRLNGPAVEGRFGYIAYYVNGRLHNLHGPAIIHKDGSKFYYVDNRLHRIDGPAIERADGYKAYYINHKLHRTDGPARIYSDGRVEYWINGKHLTKEEFDKLTKKDND